MNRNPTRPLPTVLGLTAGVFLMSCLGAAQAVAQSQDKPQAHTTHADHDHDHAHDHAHDHTHDAAHPQGPGRHVHGEITLNLVLEGNRLTAEIDSPAIHVVGFERAPQNAAERARIETAQAWLASGQRFLGVPRAAGCRPAQRDFSPPAADAKHANYQARHQYQCDNPAALAWVELWALRELEGVEKVVVNLIVGDRQEQVVVDGKIQRIALR